MIKAVIFDLDGTLLDTLTDLAGAVNKVLSIRGFPVHPVNNYKLMIGGGMNNLVKRALPPTNTNSNIIDHCVKEMLDVYYNTWQNNTRPYPGIPELLETLTEQGIQMAIFSNKPDAFTKKMVKKYFPEIPFKTIRGAKPDIPVKPSPEGTNRVVNKLNAKLSEIIMVGDSGVDMQTAVKAGIVGIGVLWGFREAKELQASGASHIISKPRKLAEYL